MSVCRWTTGNFTACSATCEGTQTRNVTCLCVLPSGSTIVLDDIICADQDPTIKPLEDRSCGDALCPGGTEIANLVTRIWVYRQTISSQIVAGLSVNFLNARPHVKEYKLGQSFANVQCPVGSR
jgi:hypothetical protein